MVFSFSDEDTGLLDEFGQSATYTPLVGSAVAITGIKRDLEPELNSPGVITQFFIGAVSFTPARGAAVAIGSDSYKITDFSKDSTGAITLELKHA